MILRSALNTQCNKYLRILSQQQTCKSLSSQSTSESTTELVDKLLSHTSTLLSTQNLIAFSGGVDSSLVASLVHQTSQKSLAVMGISPSLPEQQRKLAHDIAHHIGIPIQEVHTKEGDNPIYVENKGQSCYICKSNLYSSINAIARHVDELGDDVVLFNGTNKDDVKDTTRVGLLAAKDFKVRSPIVGITKEQVRLASRHIGLPNWNHAASPCLRSRLAFGVEATPDHLLNVSKAEEYIKRKLSLSNDINFRVRVLAKKRIRIELDEVILNQSMTRKILESEDVKEYIREIGFTGGIVDVRLFKSGSVARKVEGVRIIQSYADAA